MANYLGFAQAYNNLGNPMSEGLDKITGTMQQNRLMSLREGTADREMQLREAAAARAAEAQGIHNRLSLASLQDTQDKRAGLMGANKVGTMPEVYQKQEEAAQAKAAQEQKAKELESERQGWQIFGNTIKILKEAGATDDTITRFTKGAIKQNPKYADMVDYITFSNGNDMEGAKNYAEGELKDPVTGQPLPAGYYKTKGKITLDPANPFKLEKYELVPQKSEYKDRTRPEGTGTVFEESYDGGKTWKVVSKGTKPPKESSGYDPVEKIVATEAIKDLPKLRREARTAESSKTRIDQMLGLLKGGNAGGLQGNILSGVAKFFDTEATSEAELYKKLASAGAGQLRASVIGPGQVSNYEQQLLQSVSGGGAGARSAIIKLMQYYKQEADKTINNYDDALESASRVAPSAAKAFEPIGRKTTGQPTRSGKPAAKDPLGIL